MIFFESKIKDEQFTYLALLALFLKAILCRFMIYHELVHYLSASFVICKNLECVSCHPMHLFIARQKNIRTSNWNLLKSPCGVFMESWMLVQFLYIRLWHDGIVLYNSFSDAFCLSKNRFKTSISLWKVLDMSIFWLSGGLFKLGVRLVHDECP